MITITCPHLNIPVSGLQPLAYIADNRSDIISTSWAIDGHPINSTWTNRNVIDAMWDTTNIPNGDYTLSLIVTILNGDNISMDMPVKVIN